MTPVIRRRIAALLVALGLLLVLAGVLLLALEARAGDTAYLHAWTDRTDVYTLSTFSLHVDSKVLVNVSGNLTLVPNPSPVNVTLRDVDHDVIVRTVTIPLFNGTADYPIAVEPNWTTSFINISVVDYVHGLIGYAGVQAHLSDTYLLYLFKTDWLASFQAFQAQVTAAGDARVAQVELLAALFAVSWFFLMLLLFLRADHRRSRGMGMPSLWDRFASWSWPYSLLPDEFGTWSDPEKTWDRGSAVKWRDRRVVAAIKRIRGEHAELDELEEDIVAGKVIFE